MSEEATATDSAEQHGAPSSPLRRILKWLAVVVGGLLVVVLAIVIAIDTDPGRRAIVRFINGMETASGLQIHIDELEGSLFGELRVRGLTLSDPKGRFFSAPLVELDWRPLAYLNDHIDIRSAVIPQARLRRLPELNPSGGPDEPLLPDLDIDIDRLDVARLQIDPAVTGRRHLLSIEGSAKIADRRAQIAADIEALRARGIAGGDRLVVRLDAVPEANRLGIDLRLRAPRDGFVSTMTGLQRAITARISGQGDWRDWKGRSEIRLGGEAIADLSILARSGTITVDGPLRPGLLVEGPLQRLAAPSVQLNFVTSLNERRASIRARLRSRAMAVAAEGLVDFGQSRFKDFKLAARLLEPGAIAPNLHARDLTITLVLNGPIATPRVAYDLQAGALGFGETIVERLRARGGARIDSERIIVPVSAQAARIAGLNPALGGLLTNVRIDGSFATDGRRILSDNLRIRSDKLNATAVVVADLAKGEYRGAIKGRVDNYAVEGIGLLDVTTDLDVVRRTDGFGLTGRVVIRTRRIDNKTARDLIGGNAVITARLRMDPSGVFRIDAIRLRSPQLNILSGSGRYQPGGKIAFSASGISEAYGRLAVEVTGTAQAPNIRIRASQPGLGIGLSGVDARIRRSGSGYTITATGQSRYGPFDADVIVSTAGARLGVEISRLTFAGLNFSGRVVQTAAGPFAGTLSVTGSGLSGTVRLAAAGRYQRVDLTARADAARIPGDVPILIQRGIIQATAILYPNAPSVVADIQLAGLRSGQLHVETARARINYRDGQGRAQLVAEGSRGVPFRAAVNAALSPSLIRVAAQGSVNRIAFRLARPAELRKIPAGWQLSPTTVALPQGDIRLAGRFGDALVVRSRFTNIDLSIVNAFARESGLGGTLSGSLDFDQSSRSAFPRAEARLNIEDFTRTGVATRSSPVDIVSVARLGADGGAMNVVIRRGDAVIGRAQVRLNPLSPAAGSWMQRLLASPLGGGIRYNGPAEILWSLTGMADQQLSGPVGIAADFSGRVQNPQIRGVIRANALRYENQTYGTRITELALDGRFNSSRLEITRLAGGAGSGTVTGGGSIDLAAARGYPIDISLVFDRARLARSNALGATATGTVTISNSSARGALISGELRLPEARYQIIRQGAAEIAELEGVRRKGEQLLRPDQQETAAPPSIWKLDLRVRADNEVYVSGMGLESEWETDIRIRGTSATPIITGRAEVLRGTFSFGGRRFELNEGVISFTGSRPVDPRINISATTEVDDITAQLNISGSSSNPRISLTSSPSLPQDEILARLFFGTSVTNLSAMQAIQLAASLNTLSGSGGGLNPLGQLRSASGIDRLRILGADETTGRGTAVAAGLHISNDIYVEVITDARGFTATQLEVALSKSLSILSQVGSFGSSSFNVRYSKDY